RLDHCEEIFRLDLNYAVHAREVEAEHRHVRRVGDEATLQAGASAKGDKRHTLVAAPAQRGLHVRHVLGEDDRKGRPCLRDVLVAPVRLEHCWAFADFLAKDRPQRRERDGHVGSPFGLTLAPTLTLSGPPRGVYRQCMWSREYPQVSQDGINTSR